MNDGVQKSISIGNLAASGVVITLLVSSIQTLNTYGAELSGIRDTVRSLDQRINSAATELDARMNAVETQQNRLRDDMIYLQKLASNSGSDAQAIAELKSWVYEQFEQERVRQHGSGPVSLHSLMEIQRAIAKIQSDDKSGWTREGKPRVDAIKVHLGRPLSELERDRAWSILQVMRNLQH